MTQPPSLVTQQEPAPQTQPVAVANANPPPSQATASADRGTGATSGAADFSNVHASPSVRRVARELGVDLTKLKGTGEKGRVTKDDVLSFLKGPSAAPATAAAPAGSGVAGHGAAGRARRRRRRRGDAGAGVARRQGPTRRGATPSAARRSRAPAR